MRGWQQLWISTFKPCCVRWYFLNESHLLISAHYCNIVYNTSSLRETKHFKSAAFIWKWLEPLLQLYIKREKGVKLKRNVERLYISIYYLLKLHMFWAVIIWSHTHHLAILLCCSFNCILSLSLVSFMLLLASHFLFLLFITTQSWHFLQLHRHSHSRHQSLVSFGGFNDNNFPAAF